jgi:RimJ/RimL family protein N-acetyltransferase
MSHDWKPERAAYRIVTPRLVLRCWTPADAPALQTAIGESLPELKRWLRFAQPEPEPVELKVARLRRWRAAFDLDEYFQYGVFTRGEPAVRGGAAILPRVGPAGIELSYWLHTACHGQGFASEAVAALVQVALGAYALDRVEIHCDPANAASAAIPRRLGFRHETTLRRRLPSIDDRSLRDRMVWTLWADELAGSPAAAVPVEAFDALDAGLPLG